MSSHDSAGGSGSPKTHTEIPAEEVEAFLRRHPSFVSAFLPSFFTAHPELLVEALADAFPAPVDEGNVADFQTHALRHLRQELTSLKAGAQELLHNARTNLSIQARTHEAALSALRAPSFDALTRTISDEMPILLDVDLVMLCVEQGLPKGAAIYVQELHSGAVDRLIGLGEDCRLRPEINAEPALYGSGVGLVQSDALVRLPLPGNFPPALLALGSRRGGTFYPGQGTDLLTFLAAVVASCVERWVGH